MFTGAGIVTLLTGIGVQLYSLLTYKEFMAAGADLIFTGAEVLEWQRAIAMKCGGVAVLVGLIFLVVGIWEKKHTE
ncbi:MAG: hypothetical protein IJN25_00385 [Clostridia bacterium]|nr:hypothetical protein [Oscillospiraceae bacterium]MBQ7032110.1 hypothetical protein [Clostridia bacterium]